MDFVLQTTHQSLAHRLWLYTQPRSGESALSFYPEGFADEVIEVGPCTDRAGPCLVHYKRSQLTPATLNAWITTNTSANTAVVRVFWLGSSPSVAISREDLVRQLLAAWPAPDGSRLRLQCFPRTLEGWLGDKLPLSFNLQPVNPSWALHIVCLPARQPAAQAEQQQAEQQHKEVQEGERFVYSLQPSADMYNYQPVREKRVPDQLCKAAGKLAEALQAAGLELTSGVAVDLGAAPGGWTHVLAQRAQRVIAVDPAPMDERALVSGVVTHLACKAEAAVERIHEMVGGAGVDLLVSDVNRHPSQIVCMLRPLLPLLHPGAALVMTLKFFGRGGGREEEWRQKMAAELGPEFERVQLLWLLANTQHEQTCLAFKIATPVAEAEASSHGLAPAAYGVQS